MRTGITRNRTVRRGMDKEKLVLIWRALEGSDWLHIAEIARRTGVNEVTVRWYLDHYLDQAIEVQKIVPTIRLRLVRLKPGMDLPSYMRARRLIEEVKKS